MIDSPIRTKIVGKNRADMAKLYVGNLPRGVTVSHRVHFKKRRHISHKMFFPRRKETLTQLSATSAEFAKYGL